jgi:hypothetical protein
MIRALYKAGRPVKVGMVLGPLTVFGVAAQMCAAREDSLT